MTMLGFFGDLWNVVVQFVSLFSVLEMVILIVCGAFCCYAAYAFIEWGMNPNKYNDNSQLPTDNC